MAGAKSVFASHPDWELTKLLEEKFEGKEDEFLGKLFVNGQVITQKETIKETLSLSAVKIKKVMADLQNPEIQDALVSAWKRVQPSCAGEQARVSEVKAEKAEPSGNAQNNESGLGGFFGRYASRFPGSKLEEVLKKKEELNTPEFFSKLMGSANLTNKDDAAYEGLSMLIKKSLVQEFADEERRQFVSQQAVACGVAQT